MTRIRSRRVWGLVALLLVAVLVVWAAGPARLALAEAFGGGRTFDSTFTKWVVSPGTPPFVANMVGVVGGDVGAGTYAGEVLSRVDTATEVYITALYHFNGSEHTFTARLAITQTVSTGIAVITGRVDEGWHQGEAVTGEFSEYAVCPIPTPGNLYGTTCWEGALHIQGGVTK